MPSRWHLPLQVVHAARHAQIFEACQIRIKAHVVGQVSHKALDVDGLARAVNAVDGSTARAGLCKPQQHQRGGFAGAVGTQQAQNLTLPDDKRQAVYGGKAAVFFAQALNVDDMIGHGLAPPELMHDGKEHQGHHYNDTNTGKAPILFQF